MKKTKKNKHTLSCDIAIIQDELSIEEGDI